MTSDEKVLLIETHQRSKSNLHQIEEIKEKLKLHDEKFEQMHSQNVSLARLTVILEEMREDNKAQAESNKEQASINKETISVLGEIKNSMMTTNNKIEAISLKQDSTDLKMCDMYTRIEKVDKKSKIELDLLELFKKYWWKILLVLGGCGGTYTWLKPLIVIFLESFH